jgi:hypothetical protein
VDAPSLTEHPIENVLYCSTECQKSDRKNHKTLCNRLQNRKLLYRAGSILQEIFYISRERSWGLKIPITVKRGQLVHIYARLRQGCEEAKFPQRLPLEICHDEEQQYLKEVVLSGFGCTHSVIYMHDMFKYILSGRIVL